MQTKSIKYSDNTTNKVTLFATKQKSEVTLLCLPALGVRASYYEVLGKALCEENFNVITADWRGLGESSVRPSRKVDFGYKELVSDIKTLAENAKIWFPNTKVIILGHSLGGQMGSLLAARYSELIDGLILVASCSVYHKGWTGWKGTQVKVVSRVFPILSTVVGYFPGKTIGFGGKEARTVMKDWSANGLSGKYILTNSDYDYEIALSQMIKPVLAISIENDTMAPVEATKILYGKFNPNSSITHQIVPSKQNNLPVINHFNWAKHPAYTVNFIKNWIAEIDS